MCEGAVLGERYRLRGGGEGVVRVWRGCGEGVVRWWSHREEEARGQLQHLEHALHLPEGSSSLLSLQVLEGP